MTTKQEYEARLDGAIALMQRVIEREDRFYMGAWTRGPGGGYAGPNSSEESYHSCGMTTCFGGWVAVSPEFQDAGGSVSCSGSPMFMNSCGYRAIAQYFGWDPNFAANFCFTGYDDLFYGVEDIYDITAELVLEKLLEIKSGELNPY